MSDVHDQALLLLVQPQVGVFLTAEAREKVLQALEAEAKEADLMREEALVARSDAQLWQTRAMTAEAKLYELRERFDMIIGLAAIDKPEGSPAPVLPEKAGTPSAADSPKVEQEAGDVSANDRAEVDDSLTPEQIQRDSDDDAAAILAEEMNPPGRPFTCAGWNKSANVVCGTKQVSVVHEGKHYCLRHQPDRKTRLEAGATP